MEISRRHWIAGVACAPWASLAIAEDGPRKLWPRGRATPALQLPAMDGTTWSLASARGRPLLLNWWATWCEPCRAEMPSLQQLAAQHQAQGLQVLAINFKEGEGAVQKFLGATGLALPVLFDRDGAAAKAFGVRIFPSTIGIDRQGKARFVVTGEVDWAGEQARRWVAALL